MKLSLVALVLALEGASTFQFQAGRSWSRRSTLRMVAAPERGTLRSKIEKRDDEGKLKNKVEQIKLDSDGLREPLLTEMTNDEIFISHDAYQIMKYHGSYQQDDREKRKPRQEKAWQFMLRLKMPAGEVPPQLYRTLDDLCMKYGQQDLRATTRQAWQLHGVMKGDLKTVIQNINDIGGSTVGACGDVSRNVMTTPAPKTSKPYQYAREYSKVMAELFKPQSQAFADIWQGDISKGEEKDRAATVEYWRKDIDDAAVQAAAEYDSGRGIILKGDDAPNGEYLYGSRYLPRKFKIGVTVAGDNSIDVYINDIGIVVITDENEDLLGFNVMVGGGLGRTHKKESTFARAADHLGFVKPEDLLELCKSILAAQRDHGNRDVRANARMKYLVHSLGIDGFRDLVEGYFGKKIEPWHAMPEWKYSDWMGWHEQGDGKLFLGLNIESGRVKDTDEMKLKTCLRHLVDTFDMPMILSPSQSIILKDIKPEDKHKIEAVLAEHNVPMINQIDPLTRLYLACPALPLCGLAMGEAERAMPNFVERTRALLNKMDLGGEEIMMRMTGCPNGCARPYMAELAWVGDGKDSYQLWLGGSPVLEGRTGYAYKDRVKAAKFEEELEPILHAFKTHRLSETEAFGDFTHRVGKEQLAAWAEASK